MRVVATYRGRQVSQKDVATIQSLIESNPTLSRRALSKRLCEIWNWRQKNGALRDMVCRGLMLELHRAGYIELPPVKNTPPNPLANRRRPAPVEVDQSPVQGTLSDLGPLTFYQVRRTKDEPLFNSLLETHHYLGYTQPVGEHLKFLVKANSRPVACFSWSSAVRHLGPRDRYIGWTPRVRQRNLRLLAYNSRFLILPWFDVRYLASHLLGRMTRALSEHWEQVYEHPVVLAETFVDPTRFTGTCYRAANWVGVGRTTGRGKDDQTNRPNRPKKEVLCLPLHRRFRQLLLEKTRR